MNLQTRIGLASRLREYILNDVPAWNEAKTKAGLINPWFTMEFIDLAIKNIADEFLTEEKIHQWLATYNSNFSGNKKIGVVMAGNIPLVGFHDFFSVFISGHSLLIKPSSKDEVLIHHLVEKMKEWNPDVADSILFGEMLKGCDAYIATGSNNSSRYFEYYFSKWPHIIRKNRTSAAVLEGNESSEELSKLADDVHLFFGMGCRNVTRIFVPMGYDFIPLLEAFKKYNYFKDHHKYKNNYDYNLALHILNNKFYMTNESIILMENDSFFSPISQLNYSFYTNKIELLSELKMVSDLQCIVGGGEIPYGKTQCPGLSDYADGVDTMRFLTSL